MEHLNKPVEDEEEIVDDERKIIIKSIEGPNDMNFTINKKGT